MTSRPLISLLELTVNHARPLLLAVSTLALLISACSQPLDSQAQTSELAPQFGTQDSEYVAHVAVNTEGIYLGGSWEGKPALIKYTRAGRLPWVKFPQPAQGEWAHWESGDGGIRGVELSADGHIHVLQRAGTDGPSTYYLSKYAPNGSLLWKRRFVLPNYGSASALALDGHGNQYVLIPREGGSLLHKHNAKGALLWSKSLPSMYWWGTKFVATPDGSVYVAHRPYPYDSQYKGRLLRYDPAGRRVWERKVTFEIEHLSLGRNGAVYAAGTGYTYAYIDAENHGDMPSSIKIARYTSSGGVSWTKTVADWTATVTQGPTFWLLGLATDAQDGAYVVLSSRESPMLRKYGSNGARLWSRTFELRAGAELRGIAVLSPSEIYLTGDLPQAEAHGPRDGFLLRLNGQGERVWTR